ncbi:AbiV family abortive infection protein [Xanthomonas arboricola]
MILYRDWAKSASENAVQLAIESRLLESYGHLPRAYYLCHMSIEESSKSLLLSASFQSGVQASQLPKIKALLRDHKKKISFVVQLARDTSPILADALKGKEAELIGHMNSLKNETMYVSASDGAISTPAKRVKSVQVTDLIQLAERMAEWAKAMSAAC